MIRAVIILALLFNVVQSVLDQIYFNTLSCNFSILENKTSKQNFTFNYCRWKGCQTWSLSPQLKVCITEIDIVSHKWQNCMTQCCEGNTLPQGYQSLNECYYNKASMSIWKAILYGVSAYVGVKLFFEVIGRLCSRMSLQDQQRTCPICLQTHLDAKLDCQHFYHAICLKEEMKRRTRCPMCMSQATKVAIYCNNCRSCNYTLTIAEFINNSNVNYCKICRNKCKKR